MSACTSFGFSCNFLRAVSLCDTIVLMSASGAGVERGTTGAGLGTGLGTGVGAMNGSGTRAVEVVLTAAGRMAAIGVVCGSTGTCNND